MKNRRKFFVLTALIVAIIAFECVAPAYANSAQSSWRGVDGFGVITSEGDCPLVVESELLTLDLQEFPKNYYENLSDYLSYTGKVTAEYTFYNPSSLTVTATLAFPFGSQPDYANNYDEKAEESIVVADAFKYQITLNGENVEQSVRHTLNGGSDFDVTKDLAELGKVYMDDEFYRPSTVVTKYTYVIGGKNKQNQIDKETYKAANVACDFTGDGNTKIYFPSASGYRALKSGGSRLSVWADNGDVFSVYAIGEPLKSPLDFKCYKDGGCEDKEQIGGGVELTATETLSFEEFVFENYEESYGVSKVDWYNAVLAAFISGSKTGTNLNVVFDNYGLGYSGENFAAKLMRWYEYEITVEPFTRAVNVVTAPIYPSIDLSYKPSVCKYTYLLSPAKTWKSFGSLDIVINTTYYLSESSLQGFLKTESGYKLSLEGLPSSELTFNLSTSENPVKPTYQKKGCSIFK